MGCLHCVAALVGRICGKQAELAKTAPRRGRSSSPPPSPSKRPRPDRRHQSFHSGTGGKPLLAPCAVCLGRQPHDPVTCQATVLWDGHTKARCGRTSAGGLLNPKGEALCIRWQLQSGCREVHSYKHECSGCGDASHGACKCPLAQTI